jgi:hypothetical protein
MPNPGGESQSGEKGTSKVVAAVKAGKAKVNQRTRATVKALKHGGFSSSGYKPKSKK